MNGKKLTVGLFIQDQLKQDPVKYGSIFIGSVGLVYFSLSYMDCHPSLALMTSVGLGSTGTVTAMSLSDPYLRKSIEKLNFVRELTSRDCFFVINAYFIGAYLRFVSELLYHCVIGDFLDINFFPDGILKFTLLAYFTSYFINYLTGFILDDRPENYFNIEESIAVLNSSSQCIPDTWTISDRQFTTDQMNRLCDAISTQQITGLHIVRTHLSVADVVRLANITGLKRLIFPTDTFLGNVGVSALASSPSLIDVAGGFVSQPDKERLLMAFRRNLLMLQVLQGTYRLHVLSPLMYEVTDHKPLLPEDVFRHIASFLLPIPTDVPNKPLEEVISHQRKRSERSPNAFFSIQAPLENMNEDQEQLEYACR